ncbi:hypothetical protein DH2020_018623 [Rehmannia glutinosa]|uniref:LOB domain-containing protein n=1 Tax=Rehmannia glutinosa TaxID=99300 RepID=A0ABR0WJF3_REHGL
MQAHFHQRRRCDQICFYARYFPSKRTEDFQNVHILLGINNTMKIINSVNEQDRDKIVETLILEARIRNENPVHGPLEVENRLRAEIGKTKKELEIVNKQLQFFRGNNESPSDEGTSKQSARENFTP